MENLSNSNAPSKTIMMLNDDCLQNILRRLTRLDRISFVQTSSRFLDAYQQVSKVLDRYLDAKDLIELSWDVKYFLKLSGQNVIEVFYNNTFGNRVDFWNFCINLESLTISGKSLTVDNLSKIFPKLKKLQNLDLSICDLKDDCLLELKYLTQLKKLALSFNCALTGLNMNRLPASIESLNLTNCTAIQSRLLPEICKSLPKLKELNIMGIHTKSQDFHHFVSRNCCDSLETLTLSIRSDDHEYEHIAKLPKLKNITLVSEFGMFAFSQVRSELLAMLFEHKSEDLHHFEIRGENSINSVMMFMLSKLSSLRSLVLPDTDAIGDKEIEALSNLQNLEKIDLSFCKNVCNNAVLKLILDCPKLQVLHLNTCREITDELLSNIILNLRQQIDQKKAQRPLPIKMFVHGTKINKFILQNDIIDVDLGYDL